MEMYVLCTWWKTQKIARDTKRVEFSTKKKWTNTEMATYKINRIGMSIYTFTCDHKHSRLFMFLFSRVNKLHWEDIHEKSYIFLCLCFKLCIFRGVPRAVRVKSQTLVASTSFFAGVLSLSFSILSDPIIAYRHTRTFEWTCNWTSGWNTIKPHSKDHIALFKHRKCEIKRSTCVITNKFRANRGKYTTNISSKKIQTQHKTMGMATR